MRVLVAGAGGREHALAWRLSREPGVTALFCAPGNAGIAPVAELVADRRRRSRARCSRSPSAPRSISPSSDPSCRSIAASSIASAPPGRRVFGPPRAAAQLECSKVFAKGFMARHGIPTARYRVCESAADARAAIASGEFGFPVVLKADGLAAGKGVVVAADRAEADAAIRAAMEEQQFGAAGARLVIEECLVGPEVSFFALCDGTRAIPITSAQDHKRIFDDDQGPNTGGMGAFAPSPLLDASTAGGRDGRHRRAGAARHARRRHRVPRVPLCRPDDDLRRAEGHRIQRPVRRSRGAGRDAAHRRRAAAAARRRRRRRSRRSARRRSKSGVSVGVVLASAGYPGPRDERRRHRRPVSRRRRCPASTIFHSGTALADKRIVTAGGRVLTVVGTGADLPGRDRSCVPGRVSDISSRGCSTAATSAAKRWATREIRVRVRFSAKPNKLRTAPTANYQLTYA